MILDAGKTVFFGPAEEAADYFDKYLGFPVPSYINPADFFIDVVCGPVGKQKGIDYENVFNNSPLFANFETITNKNIQTTKRFLNFSNQKN